MNKQDGVRAKYCIQWNQHAKHLATMMCSFMEHQTFIDVAICCGTNTVHAHKCVLASYSPYLKEQFEKNSGTEQIVITGLDFSVIKSIMEFIYCGETTIVENNLKYVIALAKLFQLRGLQSFITDNSILEEADAIEIPALLFISKKPKYSNAYRPINNCNQSPLGTFRNLPPNDIYMQKKLKRKLVRSEAEQACAKEAAASRMALEALQKELSNSQDSSFVIEESCTETTVENFIPHTEDSYIENFNQVPLQVITYANLNNSMLSCPLPNIEKNSAVDPLQYDVGEGDKFQVIDKIRDTVGNNIFGNVEIMFKTNDGRFTNITDDIMTNFTEGGIQYQLVDEQGQVDEIEVESDLSYENNYTSKEKDQESISPKIIDTHTETYFAQVDKKVDSPSEMFKDDDINQIVNNDCSLQSTEKIDTSIESKEVDELETNTYFNDYPPHVKNPLGVNELCMRLCEQNIEKNSIQSDCVDEYFRAKRQKIDNSNIILNESFEVNSNILPVDPLDVDERMKENTGDESAFLGIPYNSKDNKMKIRKKKY